MTYSYLDSWISTFTNYDKRCIQVTVQFNAINAQNMSGGFCMYMKQWQYATDPNNPLVDNTSAGANVTTEQLGISCSVVKATTGP